MDAAGMMDAYGIHNLNPSAVYIPGSYDPYVDAQTDDIYTMLDDETSRSMRDALMDQSAMSEARGLGSSTYDIEARKAIGGAAARQRSANLLTATQMAMDKAKARQALDMNEYNIGADADQRALELALTKYKTATDSSDRMFNRDVTTAGVQSQQLTDSIKSALAQQGMSQTQIEDWFKNQGLARANYVDSMSSIPDDQMSALAYAFNKYQGLSGLRGSTINEVTGLTTQPYALQAGFFQNAASTGYQAGQLATQQSKMTGDALTNMNTGFGSMLSKFFNSDAGRKTTSWLDNLFSSGSGGGTTLSDVF
jgi:hypothetical protein